MRGLPTPTFALSNVSSAVICSPQGWYNGGCKFTVDEVLSVDKYIFLVPGVYLVKFHAFSVPSLLILKHLLSTLSEYQGIRDNMVFHDSNFCVRLYGSSNALRRKLYR